MKQQQPSLLKKEDQGLKSEPQPKILMMEEEVHLGKEGRSQGQERKEHIADQEAAADQEIEEVMKLVMETTSPEVTTMVKDLSTEPTPVKNSNFLILRSKDMKKQIQFLCLALRENL